MAVLRKAGKCSECGGLLPAGAQVEWVKKGGRNQPKHPDFLECFNHIAERELALLEKWFPRAGKRVRDYLAEGHTKAEIGAFFASLQAEWRPDETFIITVVYSTDEGFNNGR